MKYHGWCSSRELGLVVGGRQLTAARRKTHLWDCWLLRVALAGWIASIRLWRQGTTGRGSQAGCSGVWYYCVGRSEQPSLCVLACRVRSVWRALRTGTQALHPHSMSWLSRAHRRTVVWTPWAQPELLVFRPSVVLTFPVVGDDWRCSYLCMGRSWAPVSSGLCGLNECALSICPLHPFIFIIKTKLLSSPSMMGAREKLRPAFWFSLAHLTYTYSLQFDSAFALHPCCYIRATCRFPQGTKK